MQISSKATRIELFNFRSPQMRAFHMSWFAFFLCFFAWFGIVPLMDAVRTELQLTREQVGWCIIASVSFTVIGRLLMGCLCDRIGPRRAYTWLLILGSFPVMGIGFANNFETFLIFRLMIGAIGASFVITQYHTAQMFAPNCIGTATSITAGWGNLGGGVAKPAMSLLLIALVGGLGLSTDVGWRMCMVIAGAICLLTGIAYYYLTQDTPEGDFKDLRAAGKMPSRKQSGGSFITACKDPRVWALFFIYAACFGMELTIYGVADLYFIDYFALSPLLASSIAGLYGAMNIFSRPLGGYLSDRLNVRLGLRGRVKLLFVLLFCEGLMLMLFSQLTVLTLAIPALIIFALFVQMSNGATYSIVPFINKKSMGSVAGIVGAGGNVGAIAAGFFFKGDIPWPTALLILGAMVTACSFLAFLVRFSQTAETEARHEMDIQLNPESAPKLASI